MNHPGLEKRNNVYIHRDAEPDAAFAKVYLALREKEKRVYSREELANLPDIRADHPHYHEWRVRKASCEKLKSLLAAKQKPLQILEVGCGNGWLSNQLAKVPDTQVTGLDVNLPELEQGAAVFSASNLRFVYGELRDFVLGTQRFDVIIFAAAVAYFPSLPEIIRVALQHLQPGGEIHIVDTFFYEKSELPAARQRTLDYYGKMGFPEMARHYFHFSLEDLDGFNYTILQKNNPFLQRLLRRPRKFHWVCIRPD
ncbi:class I SAM-dependent methyltransferase [uncultured Chitinophaga sp.]|jgi:Methylase involved in ubiquinone/menaquinone biosynthesis|uniref:class I SAM-dependent methyltransferase n=1 Tax=uncultured Chitinophaga sp. TaxID=339340 RepID=UPI0026022052|nr:class I SAM-dependent methyltransferase [uncultured Chitinophaga sp.]